MKTSVGPILLTLVIAYGAASIRFDGENDGYWFRDENGKNVYEDSILSYNQEADFKNSYKDLNTNNDDRFNEDSNRDMDNNEYNVNWFSNQSGRSMESFRSTEGSGEQYAIQTAKSTNDGSFTLGHDIVRKIATLDEIIAQEHQCNGNLLDMENPLSIKKSVVKVTKKNFVSFQNAELRNLKNGSLIYLSINPEKDNVYVECAFDKLSATGTFKSNLDSTKGGKFVVDMNSVLSNVSASFHKGKATVRPARLLTANTYVIADNLQDVDAIIESVDRKYRSVLERAISAEIYNSTHKGMVDQLKTEMKTSLRGTNNERTVKLYDLDWTEGNLDVQIMNIGGQSWKRFNQKIDSMSYTRKDDNTYKMRFDVNLKEFQWTSDLTATLNGQRAQAKSLEFIMENVQIHVVVFKSIDRQECRQIETDVRIRGLQYNLNGQLPSFIKSTVELKLPLFIERSFKAYMKNLIKLDVCKNYINAY